MCVHMSCSNDAYLAMHTFTRMYWRTAMLQSMLHAPLTTVAAFLHHDMTEGIFMVSQV